MSKEAEELRLASQTRELSPLEALRLMILDVQLRVGLAILFGSEETFSEEQYKETLRKVSDDLEEVLRNLDREKSKES